MEIVEIYKKLGQDDEAMSWYLKAADGSIAEAQLIIGEAYLYGKWFGRVKNYILAYKYWKDAQIGGIPKAKSLVTKMTKEKLAYAYTNFETVVPVPVEDP